ncbi:unnamed protein product [Parnassius mnemosyne]
MDVSLMGLNLEDAKVTIDMKSNEITITPNGTRNFLDDYNDMSEKPVHFNAIEEKLNIGDKITQAFENFQDGLDMFSEYRQKDMDDKHEISGNDACSSKLTIRGPGNYIKKIIQQFSEGPFEIEDPKPESERAIPALSIRDRADAICKKCLHYKGKIGK